MRLEQHRDDVRVAHVGGAVERRVARLAVGAVDHLRQAIDGIIVELIRALRHPAGLW